MRRTDGRLVWEAEGQERARRLSEAEQPIVADLRAVGVMVDSSCDLVNTSDPYPAALPVLMEHLERGGYPARVTEGLGRALAVKPSVAFWERLKARWLDARFADGSVAGAEEVDAEAAEPVHDGVVRHCRPR